MKRVAVIPGMNSLAIAMALAEDSRLRQVAVDAEAIVSSPRNYDIEGPKHEWVPPEPPTRQQRRWLERQAKKHSK